MKKLILISLLVLLFSGLTANSHFTGIFTLLNNSSTDVAFGNDSGAANIWNTTPLSAWSNPAKLGYHNGVAWGYSDDAWFDKIYDDIYHTSSYLSAGWKGIGIMLPMPARESKFGTYMAYGEQAVTDENENQIGSIESYDHSKKYAIGVNLLQFSSNFIAHDDFDMLQNYGELSIGYSYSKIKIVYPGYSDENIIEATRGKSHTSGLGIIARFSPLNRFNAKDKCYKLDLTAGIYYLNHEKSEITFSHGGETDHLPWGTNTAFSGKFSLNLSAFQGHEISFLNYFTDNLFSIYYSQDNSQLGKESNQSYWGEGVEFCLLDFFSFRRGQYVNRSGRVTGSTYGYGINFNFMRSFQFQYNVTNFPGGDLQDEQTKSDYMLRVDFLKAYEMVR